MRVPPIGTRRPARLQTSIPLCNGALRYSSQQGGASRFLSWWWFSPRSLTATKRVVVTLVLQTLLPRSTPTVGGRMNPTFVIDGVRCVLHPLDEVSVAVDQLREVVGSLAQEGQIMADARDELLTKSWG